MCRCVWGGGGGYWSLTLCMHCSSFDPVFVSWRVLTYILEAEEWERVLHYHFDDYHVQVL